METKDLWDKLGSIASTVTAVMTVIITIWTNNLSNKLDNFKATTEEGKTVSDLIKELSTDNKSTIKYDYAFLSLERYLRNIGNGDLKPQDKAMLVGFATALINDRIYNNTDTTRSAINRITIPEKFLKDNDSLGFQKLGIDFTNQNKIAKLPEKIKPEDSLSAFEPVSQPVKSIQARSINLIFKKIVYIQYSNLKNKDQALEIQQKFKLKEWVTPNIDNVPGVYKNTIRYFHNEDYSSAKEAQEVLGNKYKLLRVYNFESKVPKGQIEVWINNN